MPINASLAYNKYFGRNARRVPLWKEDDGNGTVTVRRNPEQQFELDVAFWYGTLTRSNEDEREFIRRVFVVLYFGGLMYRSAQGWLPWSSSGIPIAAVLSHGGRVLIQLPKASGAAADAFFDWLQGPSKIIERNRRLAATHGIEYLPYTEREALGMGRRHRIKETKHGQRHYGVNISLGGTGNINPISGNTIASDGEHGHLYVFYLPPTADNYGGLLIGCEGSAPIDAWDNRPGRAPGAPRPGKAAFAPYAARAFIKDKVFHDPSLFTPDQTGGYHKFGERQRFSPTGNGKWEELGCGPCRVYNALIVDLVPTGWRFLISYAERFTPELLGQSGIQPINVRPLRFPKILTHTCLTEGNLQRMAAIAHDRAKDWTTIAKGKDPLVKDYNAPSKKSGNPLGNHIAKKPMNLINPSISQIAGGIDADANDPMTLNTWLHLSNVRFAKRSAALQDIDTALGRCLTVTRLSLQEYDSRIRADDTIAATDPDFVDRVRSLVAALNAINTYLNSPTANSDNHTPMVEALKLLILTEMKLLDQAKQALVPAQ
ncbi:MAG: hypothetical protein AA908_06295 [Chlorobi bacterium NICIL-2]|jgi:hypothetical protein|nr:MAG: hypothetical protein AA908_06295 [Chlorobi bacterium NICIL-2]